MKKLVLTLFTIIILSAAINTYAADTPAIVVADVTAKAGDTVDVTISLENNPGIVAMVIEVDYDRSALTLTNAVGSGLLPKPDINTDYTTNPYVLYWDDSTNPNNTSNGVVYTLTFAVSSSAQAKAYPIEITYDENNVFDYDFNNIGFEVKNGSITVTAGGDSGDDAQPSIAITNYAKSDTAITFDVALTSDEAVSGKVVAALFDSSDNLVQAKVYDAAETINVSLNKTQGEYINVYWWNNFDSISPVCSYETITVQ